MITRNTAEFRPVPDCLLFWVGLATNCNGGEAMTFFMTGPMRSPTYTRAITAGWFRTSWTNTG